MRGSLPLFGIGRLRSASIGQGFTHSDSEQLEREMATKDQRYDERSDHEKGLSMSAWLEKGGAKQPGEPDTAPPDWHKQQIKIEALRAATQITVAGMAAGSGFTTDKGVNVAPAVYWVALCDTALAWLKGPSHDQ